MVHDLRALLRLAEGRVPGPMEASVEGLAHLAPIIRATHEHWDGTGYRDGLSGEEIPLASRIIHACDAWHAMTSDRPYREALGGRAGFRVGVPLSALGEGLRAVARHGGRSTLRGLRVPLPPPSGHPARIESIIPSSVFKRESS